MSSFNRKYPKGKAFLKRLDEIEAKSSTENFETFKREVMLANPLLDFDKILLVKRRGKDGHPNNWQGNSSLPKNGYDNEIAILNGLDNGSLETVYKPSNVAYVGEVDLHFDAKKMKLSMCVGLKKTFDMKMAKKYGWKYGEMGNVKVCVDEKGV